MAVARAEDIISADLRAADVNLEGIGLESLEPILPLLAKMPRLKSLRLARNKLTGLPTDLSGIRQLEYFDFSANPIKGLATIMSGLYSLVNLKHLYVDLPFESEEDDIIISMQSLETFNGTSLLETFTDTKLEMEGEQNDNLDMSPKPRINEAVDTTMQGDSAMQQQEQPQEEKKDLPFLQLSGHWGTEDTKKVQELYGLVTDVTGNASTQKEFNMYVASVVKHLAALTAEEQEEARVEGETLKAKSFLYEYCLDELCREALRKDTKFARALASVVKAQTDVIERYDRLWRSVAENMNEHVALMKNDMHKAINEIESLMAQLGEANNRRSNNCNRNGVGAVVDGDGGANCEELRGLREEVGRLRTENERLRTKLRLLETPGGTLSPSPATATATAFADGAQPLQRPLFSVEHSQRMPSRSQAPQFGNKILTLKQLKSTIESIYVSKSKYDIKCAESQLPRETMEQHMYTYLNQRYGLKHIILDWATAIIQGVKKYALEDNDVAVFGKILRNEIDEEFRFVQRQVRETVQDLLRVYVKGKRPLKSDSEINSLVQKKMNGTVLEDEWVDIVKYMYNTEDAVTIIMRVREHIRQVSLPRRRRNIRKGSEATMNEAVQLPYADLIRILLDFQLEAHERFLSRFRSIFNRYDTDHNGIVNAHEFSAILKSVDPSKTDEEVDAILALIDRFENQLITYSESVTFLSAEIAKMAKDAK